jgi:hypothetical protein
MWKALINTALRFLDAIFGCWHFNTSRPFTISGHTYEVCLDCGKEFPYSLRTMSFTADRIARQALTGRSVLVPSNLDS